jgi:hypothetical protein
MKILFPPHPEGKITHESLPVYESQGTWVAQRKYNGTHVVLNVSSTNQVGLLTRHGTPPKLFSLSASHITQILSLNLVPNQEYWFAGELLDHKTTTPEYKGRIVLFDVLQAPIDGPSRYLMRRPNQMCRLSVLDEICGFPTKLEPHHGIALQATKDIWLAEHFETDFVRHFMEFIHLPEIEGLMLRKKLSAIDNLGGAEYDVSWMLRCRKPHSGGNYRF